MQKEKTVKNIFKSNLRKSQIFSGGQLSIVKGQMSKAFTLLEIMISVGLFTIIMVLGTSAVLNANVVHKKNQNQRAIIDNLNFMLEDIARNARVGSDYNCGLLDANFPPPPHFPADCPSPGNFGLSLTDMNGNQVTYLFAQWGTYSTNVPSGHDADYKLFKHYTTDNGTTWVTTNLTPDEIIFDPLATGFIVVGAGTVGDMIQPTVLIRMAGKILYKDVVTPFDVQTTVTQRATDS